MKADGLDILGFAFCGLVIGTLLGCWMGEYGGQRRFKCEAVKHGAAEWVADERGNVEFKWREKRDE